MQKNVKLCWTAWGVVIILHGLLIGAAVGEMTENVQLKKFSAKATAADEQRLIKMQREVADVRLLAAQLLYNKKSDSLSAVLQTAFDYIEKQQLVCKDFYRSVSYLKDYIGQSGGIVAADKKVLLDRLKDVSHQIERNVSIPSIVARRGGLRKQNCKVLAVNSSLDAVILDAGYINGISPGSRWQIRNSNGKTIKLQVVEVRRTISAAISVGNEKMSLKAGQVAEKAKENTLESKENYGN